MSDSAEDACRVEFHFANTADVVLADVSRDMLWDMLDRTEDAGRPEDLDDEGEPPSVSPTVYHTVRLADDPTCEAIINMTYVTYVKVMPHEA